jgi:predicted 3-demethylubiquinone-9 3-methyltransferase (glyoxalase superfamily)
VKALGAISTFLWFDDNAQEAAEFYVSVFPNSRVLGGDAFADRRPEGQGPVTLVTFELNGRPFTALNGGPRFSFTPAISFVIDCADQGEVDYYWDRLTDGGEEGMCGWLVDRFGISWQVVPSALAGLLGGPDPEGAARATDAMLQMRRLDIAALEAAYRRG